MKKGIIVAVCISAKPNIPKYPQECVEMGEYGLVGDIHAGAMRISYLTKQLAANDRQISIVAQEDLDLLNAELGIALKPGDLGENFTTQRLGSLSGVIAGMTLQTGTVVLEVTKQNDPCQNINVYHNQLVKVSYRTRTRGILAVVKWGAGWQIHPNDMIALYDH